MQLLNVALLSCLVVSPGGMALYGGETLERVHFQPMAREIMYSPLADITTVNYVNVSEVYTRVIECNQMVAALKNEMGKRLNDSVPPPHHHCFISERDLQHLTLMNQENTTQGLRCDQYMLSRFPTALKRAVRYERLHFNNEEGRTMMRVRGLVQEIQQALTNLTGLTVNATSEMTSADVEACGMYVVEPEPAEEEEAEEEELEPPEEATPTATSQHNDSPEIDPTDYSLLVRRRRRQAAEEATPTATTPTRCSAIEDAGDQFIYITELWIALYYLELDLLQKRTCLQV